MHRTSILRLASLTILVIGCLGLIHVQLGMAQPYPSEFPMYVVDGFGRNVTIERVPERIISLSPGNTETLFAIGAGSKVIGVTRYCDYPPEVVARVQAGSLNVVGGTTDPNIEIIVSLQPDLILTSLDLQKGIVTNLESKGLTVLGLSPRSVSEILENIQLVGRITGSSDTADELVQEMRTRIQEIVGKVQDVSDRPRVYFEVWYDPLMSVGPGTYVDDLVEMAGGKNIFHDSIAPYPIVNSETIIQLDPQVIIVGGKYMYASEPPNVKIESRPGWTSISAVQNGCLYNIDDDLVYRDGPRIVDGLKELALMIHPELFQGAGICTLVIRTSPRLSDIVFSINGVNMTTGTNGTIRKFVKQGSCTVKLLNLSLTVGSERMEFLQWTEASSEKNPELILNIENDTNLTANYHSSNATDSGGVIPGFPVGSVIAGLALGTTFLVLRRRTRPKSVRCCEGFCCADLVES